MTIQPYEPTDKAALLAIFDLNVPLFFAEHEREDLAAYLDEFGDTYFIVQINDQILGGAGYIIQENTASVTWIFFHPNHTGKGLGAGVMTQLLEFFNTKSRITKLGVRTSQFAHTFFERFGYKTIRIEKNYWADGFDLYEMEREITNAI